MSTRITIFNCNPERTLHEQLVLWSEEQEAAEDEAADTADRFLCGRCDICQQFPDLHLVLVSGEAICADCCSALGCSYQTATESMPTLHPPANRGPAARSAQGDNEGGAADVRLLRDLELQFYIERVLVAEKS